MADTLLKDPAFTAAYRSGQLGQDLDAALASWAKSSAPRQAVPAFDVDKASGDQIVEHLRGMDDSTSALTGKSSSRPWESLQRRQVDSLGHPLPDAAIVPPVVVEPTIAEGTAIVQGAFGVDPAAADRQRQLGNGPRLPFGGRR